MEKLLRTRFEICSIAPSFQQMDKLDFEMYEPTSFSMLVNAIPGECLSQREVVGRGILSLRNILLLMLDNLTIILKLLVNMSNVEVALKFQNMADKFFI